MIRRLTVRATESRIAAKAPGRPALRARRVAFYLTPLLILAAVWQLLSMLGVLNPKTVPSFFDVVASGVVLSSEGEIFQHLLVSLYRAEVGLLLGAALGVLLGLAMARIPIMRAAFYPIVSLTYTLPKTALIPIVLLWLGVGDSSTMFVVFIGAFVPIVITTFQGAESVPDAFVWSARSMGSSDTRILWTVVLPAALPQILNGVRIAQAFSIVIVVSAEMVAAYVGIGRFISLFGEAGNYNYMFAAIFFIVIAAFLLDQLFLAVKGRLLAWAETEGASDA